MTISAINPDLKASILHTLKYGEENALTGKQLATILGEKGTRQIRLAMVELRHTGTPVIGGQKGYFLASNITEIQKARKYLQSYIIDLCLDLRDYRNIEKRFVGQLKMHI